MSRTAEADGVSVSRQKQKRDKIAKEGRERTTTDIILLEKPLGGFDNIVASKNVSLTNLATAKLKSYYGSKEVNIVVISDGSRTIKNRCQILFGEQYQHLLDWYHLQRKVKDLMTMIAVNKVLKSEYISELNQLLWVGDTVKAIDKLRNYQVKNVEKQEELMGYLEKNIPYIIDYKRRKEVGKPIGSGRMEKAGDLIIAKRQKEKAMSWSEKGSNALAVLTAMYKNRATENLH